MDARTVMEQLLLTADFIHSQNIIHRDLKPENILVRNNNDRVNVAIADLGLAEIVSRQGFLSKKCGSPGFVAPEIFSLSEYNFKADIFSIGSIMYSLLTGRYLFNGENVQEILKENKKCDYTEMKQHLDYVTPIGRDLLLKLVEVDPGRRLTARRALEHLWFSEDRETLQNLLYINKELANPQGRLRNVSNISL